MTILKDTGLASVANSQQRTIEYVQRASGMDKPVSNEIFSIVAIHGLNHGPAQHCDWRPWTDPSLPEGIRHARVISFGYNAEVLNHPPEHLRNGPTATHAGRTRPVSRKDRAENLRWPRRTLKPCGYCSRHTTLPSLSQSDTSIESLDRLAEQVLLDLDAVEESASDFDGSRLHDSTRNVSRVWRPILFVASSLGGAIAQQVI